MIQALDVGHLYPGASDPSLSDISISATGGEMLGIVGSSGSGKSTLLQVLAGLFVPSRGEVSIQNGRSVALVMQFPEDQFFEDTVYSDVEFGPRARGASKELARSRATTSLIRMGLDPDRIGDRSPFTLNGDESRRVAIAGALAGHPDCLMLDEPTVGMDKTSREILWRDLKTLVTRDGISVMIASHDLDEVAEVCDRVIVLADSRILTEGPPMDVFSDEDALKAADLGLPRCVELADLLGDSGIQLTPAQILEAIR